MWNKACSCCFSVCELIKSPNASISVKSTLLLINALLVNSPWSAVLKYFIFERADKIIDVFIWPPWICSSTTSSPVKLFGPSKKTANPLSSRLLVSGCVKLHLVSLFGIKFFLLDKVTRASNALGPESLITASPAAPGEVDKA